jgi:hypothetical protein
LSFANYWSGRIAIETHFSSGVYAAFALILASGIYAGVTHRMQDVRSAAGRGDRQPNELSNRIFTPA